jgi:hypothetical protein
MRYLVKLGVCLMCILLFIMSKGRALRYIWVLNYLTIGIDLRYPKRLGNVVSTFTCGKIVSVDAFGKTVGVMKNHAYDDDIFTATGEGYYLVGSYSATYDNGHITGTDIYDWHSGMDVKMYMPVAICLFLIRTFPNYISMDNCDYAQVAVKDDFWLLLPGKSFTTHIKVKLEET